MPLLLLLTVFDLKYQHMIRLFFVIISALGILVACGYKGPLYLPKKSNNPPSATTTPVPIKAESTPAVAESAINNKNKES